MTVHNILCLSRLLSSRSDGLVHITSEVSVISDPEEQVKTKRNIYSKVSASSDNGLVRAISEPREKVFDLDA